MKNIFLNFLFIICGLSFSQTKITSFKNSLKTSESQFKDVIPVVNKGNDELAMFFADAKHVYGYTFDKNFIVNDSLSSEVKNRMYKVFLGSSINKNKVYRVFISNTNKSKIASIKFSFSDKKTSLNEFSLSENEIIIQTITHLNRFYLLTTSNLGRKLFLYSFDDDGNPIKNEIDVNDILLYNRYDDVEKISESLLFANPIEKFEKDTPNSIESVSEKIKMYHKGDSLLISFDYNKKRTQIISIDIPTLKATKKDYKKPLQNLKDRLKKTNSFLYENNLFVIAATKEVFSMLVLDFKTGEIIKEFAFSNTEEINFKNTPIIQEGGVYEDYRELEKTKQFLRKITANEIGLSIIKSNNNYQITIGGYTEKNMSYPPVMGTFIGSTVVGTDGASFFYNPTNFAFSSFNTTKSIRIECIFDANLQPIKNIDIPENVFDKINNSNTNNNSINTVFKYKSFYIKGDYNETNKVYSLVKYVN